MNYTYLVKCADGTLYCGWTNCLEKRLEALGMTSGTSVAVLNSKNKGVLIVKVRGTRFALGRNITKNIVVG